MVINHLLTGMILQVSFTQVIQGCRGWALNQAAKLWFHQYLDPAEGTICGG